MSSSRPTKCTISETATKTKVQSWRTWGGQHYVMLLQCELFPQLKHFTWTTPSPLPSSPPQVYCSPPTSADFPWKWGDIRQESFSWRSFVLTWTLLWGRQTSCNRRAPPEHHQHHWWPPGKRMDNSGWTHQKKDNKDLILGNLLKELSQRYQGAITVIPGPLGQDHGVIWCILEKLDITICQHPEFHNKSSYVLQALWPYELAN